MTAKETAQKSAPWVALVVALGAPLFSYLEARQAAAAAKTEARQAQDDARGASWRTGRIESTQGAVYALLAREVERLGQDVSACHKRVDRLAEAAKTLAERSRSPVAAARVEAQAVVERPAPANVPKRKGEVAPWDPLAGALK